MSNHRTGLQFPEEYPSTIAEEGCTACTREVAGGWWAVELYDSETEPRSPYPVCLRCWVGRPTQVSDGTDLTTEIVGEGPASAREQLQLLIELASSSGASASIQLWSPAAIAGLVQSKLAFVEAGRVYLQASACAALDAYPLPKVL